MDWKKNRTPIAVALLVLLAAVTGIIYSKRTKTDGRGLQEALEPELPEIASEAITSVTLVHPKHGNIELAKTDDVWRVKAPVDAAADASNIKYLVDKIGELEVGSVAATRSANHDVLGVSETNGIKVMVKASKEHTFFVGEQRGGGTMIRVDGQEVVISAKKAFRWAFDRPLSEWRDRNVVDAPDAALKSLVVKNGESEFRFSNVDGKWQQAAEQTPIKNFDPVKVQSFVSSFTSLRVADFLDGEKPATTPEWPSVTVSYSKDGSDQALVFARGPKKGEQDRLTISGKRMTYLVDSFVATKFDATAKTFATDPAEAAAAAAKPPMGGGPGGGMDMNNLPPEVRAQIEQAMRAQGR